ncbi:MAG: hypothetical protein M5U28_28230 [Sandaracinaceae bacterium]|nr:hypothetical protein [Sandaracinaceae bacterium]
MQKGGATKALRAAFMRRSLDEWDTPRPSWIGYPRERVEQFSPGSKAILELSSERDLDVLQKLYANGVLLGDQGPDGWGIRYSTEFHMTNDSKLFPPRPKWEAKGYVPDEYGHWLKGGWKPYSGPHSILERPKGTVLSRDGQQAIRVEAIEDVALPVYEGRMIGQFDFSEKGWVSGKGRSAEWREIGFEDRPIEPQFLMSKTAYLSARDRDDNPKAVRGLKLGFMDVSSATNTRTTIAALCADAPHGNKVPLLTPSVPGRVAPLGALMNSFAYDFAMRARLGGLTLNYFIVEETPLPSARQPGLDGLGQHALSLSANAPRYARAWLTARSTERSWQSSWARTPAERLRRRVMADALAASAFGLTLENLRWILRDCDHPTDLVSSNDFARRLDPKGFWRIDKEQHPELRHPVLVLIAYHALTANGRATDFESHDGWTLPDTLRLADYDLGHDERAKIHQPVASLLGPRFYDWQLAQDAAESWEECERHAELLDRILPLPAASAPTTVGDKPQAGKTDLFGNPVETDLFGNPVPRRRGRR